MLDLTKPVQTRDGRKARILCTDRTWGHGVALPVIALVQVSDDEEEVRSYTLKGGWANSSPSEYDLVNVPQRHKHADAIIAWANGAEIQAKYCQSDEWYDTKEPSWHANREFRVKPE